MAMKTDDLYLERVMRQEDVIVRQAQLQMLASARKILSARDGLQHALRVIARHPDIGRMKRAERKGRPLKHTLAWWVEGCIRSALEDAPLEDAAEWLFADSDPRRAARDLRQFNKAEADDRARAARKAA